MVFSPCMLVLLISYVTCVSPWGTYSFFNKEIYIHKLFQGIFVENKKVYTYMFHRLTYFFGHAHLAFFLLHQG